MEMHSSPRVPHLEAKGWLILNKSRNKHTHKHTRLAYVWDMATCNMQKGERMNEKKRRVRK